MKNNISASNDASDNLQPTNGRIAPHPTPAASPTPEEMAINEWSWEKVLCSDPEMLIRQASRQSETEEDNPLALQHRALDEKRQQESLRNPTEAMLEILARIEEREREREQMTWQQQLHHLNKKQQYSRSNSEHQQHSLSNPNPLTPAMEEVIMMRQTRISVDIDIPITPEPSDSDNDSDCSSHEEYVPPAKAVKKVFVDPFRPKRCLIVPTPKEDPFEFFEDENAIDASDIGQYRSCLNVVNTAQTDQQAIPVAAVVEEKEASIPFLELVKGNKKYHGKNKFIYDDDDEVEQPQQPELQPPTIKRRRISIQNDVTLIRNKESPPDPQPPHHQPSSKKAEKAVVSASTAMAPTSSKTMKAKKARIRERFVLPTKKKKSNSKKTTAAVTTASTAGSAASTASTTTTTPHNAKRLSSIPEGVFIESIQRQDLDSGGEEKKKWQEAEQQPAGRRGRGRPSKASKQKEPSNKSVSPPAAASKTPKAGGSRRNSLAASSVEMEAVNGTKKSASTGLRKNMRSSDASMRTTRAHDFKWENVLLSNPEKMLRRK
jgi:hypothetical protein